MIKETVVYIVYHDLATEARSYEMLCALQKEFNNVICVCRKPPIDKNNCQLLFPKSHSNQYVEFLKLAIDTLNLYKPKVLVLHDEFAAPFISVGKRKFNSFIVFDSSELNYRRVLAGAKNKIAKILYFIESKNIHKADLVFAANLERMHIMREKYKIYSQMEVFDNIHRIDDEYDEVSCNNKFDSLFKQYRYILLYGGGISHSRFTYEIAMDFANLEDTGILIVGSATERCKKEFYDLLTSKHINNVHYLGFVSRAEFKYLLEKSYASFVLFKSDCPNTENCASGKMYESLFRYTPIICSDNPPLKRLCDEYGVGESSLDFVGSFMKIRENRDEYVNSIKKYIRSINYEGRIDNLGQIIANAYLKHDYS